MTTNESEAALGQGKDDAGCLCAKCEHVNHEGLTACEECGAPLLVTCSHCGQESPRVLARCPKCRHRLHSGGAHRHKHHHHHRRTTNRRVVLSLIQAGLVLLGLLAAFGLVYLANHVNLF